MTFAQLQFSCTLTRIAANLAATSHAGVLDLLRQHMQEYNALILLDHIELGMMVKKALAIYRKWHVLNRQPTWGAVSFSCSCKVYFAHCICRDTILLASLFNQR